MIWSAAFWRGAAERAIKSFAQALVAVIGVGTVGILQVDWVGAVSAAALTAALSLLTSIGNADFTAGVVEPRRAVGQVANTHPSDDAYTVSEATLRLIADQQRD